ncbi:MAG: hypothetical protein LBM04_10330 [Opitutaceae bacterium]|jgi:hypothetical protein|nr:hypothetical protein [Opitutaceae bacterium]
MNSSATCNSEKSLGAPASRRQTARSAAKTNRRDVTQPVIAGNIFKLDASEKNKDAGETTKFAWAGFTVVYFCTAAFVMPGTKGRTPGEIEEHFEGKKKLS